MNNLLVGARNIDHRGQFEVVNLATNDSFQCSIKEPFFGKSRHEVGACCQGASSHLLFAQRLRMITGESQGQCMSVHCQSA